MDTAAATSAATPGTASACAPPRIFRTPEYPIRSPVSSSMSASTIAATHSIRSCPYGCSASSAFDAARTPIITTSVLNTSESECTASEIMAPECASTPASSFPADSSRFTTRLTRDTCRASFVSAFMLDPSATKKIRNSKQQLLSRRSYASTVTSVTRLPWACSTHFCYCTPNCAKLQPRRQKFGGFCILRLTDAVT